MAEVLVQFDDPVVGADGAPFSARVCGRESDGGRWEGWIEFIPRHGGEPLRTGRETVQPNHADLGYWATGLSRVYLEGALQRAWEHTLRPAPRPASEVEVTPAFSGPADGARTGGGSAAVLAPRTVLDPFAVYAQGEGVLRQELSALSADHLENVISAYALSPRGPRRGATEAELVREIVEAVRERRGARGGETRQEAAVTGA